MGSQSRYKLDAEGSPQTVVFIKRKNGTVYSVYVCLSAAGDSFRIVLTDIRRKIRKGETLEKAVRRYEKAWTKKIWPEYAELQIV
jgi:hypothetical protein